MKIRKKIINWLFKKEKEILNKEIENIRLFNYKIKQKLKDYSLLAEKQKDAYRTAINYIEELKEISDKLSAVLEVTDVSVDVHATKYSPSWAVISIQGEKTDFIKFVDLGYAELKEIQHFLRKFDRAKIDASPQIAPLLRIDRKEKKI